MNNAYLSLCKSNPMFIKGADVMILGRFFALYSETCLLRKLKNKKSKLKLLLSIFNQALYKQDSRSISNFFNRNTLLFYFFYFQLHITLSGN